jgi:uncharacterized protein YcfL
MNLKSTNRLFFVLAAALLVGVSGCTTPVGTVEPHYRRAPSDIVHESVRFNDASLARGIFIEGANQTVVSGNLKRAQVVLASARNRPQNLAYRFEWYDSDGMIIESVTSVWKPLRLLGAERTALSDVAPHARAVDFILQIKRS